MILIRTNAQRPASIGALACFLLFAADTAGMKLSPMTASDIPPVITPGVDPNGYCCTQSRFREPRIGDIDVQGNPVSTCTYNGDSICNDSTAEANANRLASCKSFRDNRRGALEVWLNGECCNGEPSDGCAEPWQLPNQMRRKLRCEMTFQQCGAVRRATCNWKEVGSPDEFSPPFNGGCTGNICSDSNECGPSSQGA